MADRPASDIESEVLITPQMAAAGAAELDLYDPRESELAAFACFTVMASLSPQFRAFFDRPRSGNAPWPTVSAPADSAT